MKIRRAVRDDIGQIIVLAWQYFKESGNKRGLEPCENTARETILKFIERDISVVIEESGKIIAFGSVGFQRTFFREKEADISFFYVLNEYRGNGASRLLAESLINLANIYGASIIYAMNGSGIGDRNDSLWVNLFTKFGLKKLGTLMMGKTFGKEV